MSSSNRIRSYTELIKLPSFNDRFEYLQLDGIVGEETFGFDRRINQLFYSSMEWAKVRDKVIVRDDGCDLGVPGCLITGPVYIHHMNPIRVNDILDQTEYLLNPDYLICVSKRTHDAIHYGCMPSNYEMVVRKPNDTCPWKM